MKVFKTYDDDDESTESVKLLDYKILKNQFTSPLNIKRIVQNQQVYLSGFKASPDQEKE